MVRRNFFDFAVENELRVMQFAFQLFAYLSDAQLRDGRISFSKHLIDKFKHSARSFQVGLQEYACEKRLEEPFDDLRGKTQFHQVLLSGSFG